jgi:hypothetical protein
VPNTLPVSKQPVGAAYHRNLTSDLLNFQSESVDLLTLLLQSTAAHQNRHPRTPVRNDNTKSLPEIGTFCFRRGIIAMTKCSCRDNQRLEGDVGFGLQGLRRGGEHWFQALLCGISKPGSLLRASIIKPTALALLWLALLLIAYRLW